ncbi:hypothetical protein [Kribbella sp. NPDC055071]
MSETISVTETSSSTGLLAVLRQYSFDSAYGPSVADHPRIGTRGRRRIRSA